MENWVDFKTIKAAVGIQQVLDHYAVKLKKAGKEFRGRCPIHKGEGSESFHANPEKNVFHCFSCQAKGNVLDFVAAMEKCSVRDAGLKLQQWFNLDSGEDRGERSSAPAPDTKPATGSQLAREEEPVAGERGEPNRPLGFQLKGIDHAHEYLTQRGVDPETAEYFGVGFFSGRGSMSGRIVIPIENERGELVAYAGRAIDGSEPKYKLPAGFKKGQVLFNLCRALEEDSTGAVVLVEGFFDCIKVTEAEHVCVALMGCSMSEEQEAQLVAHFRQVVVMLDGDEAGRSAAGEIAGRLTHKMWVRVADVPEGRQPDQLSTEELRELLGGL
jgi:DNA primase